jgi:2-phospho-L-lactate/phosphoenolpyruvate guanylyltransferase
MSPSRVLAIPVKPLVRSKTRLAPALSVGERAELTLAMFEDVLEACLDQPDWETWVVSGSREARELAHRRGARAMAEQGSSLLEAVRQAEAEIGAGAGDAGARGQGELAVILADLPLITAEALARALALPGDVVAAPAASDGGTNVLVRRPPGAIPARFGRSSFGRHRAAAYRQGRTFQEVRAVELGFDLDRPADLLTLLASDADSRARSACRRLGLAARLRMGA